MGNHSLPEGDFTVFVRAKYIKGSVDTPYQNTRDVVSTANFTLGWNDGRFPEAYFGCRERQLTDSNMRYWPDGTPRPTCDGIRKHASNGASDAGARYTYHVAAGR